MVREVEVAIRSMAFKGYGVARVDGKVLFIPYSVTGDRVLVEITEEKKDYSIGRLTKIMEPSPWRTDPPCPYFGVCGGCQWQHIVYSFHGELKREILKEILHRLGGLKEIPSSRSPIGGTLWVSCQGPAENQGKSDRLLSREIAAGRGYRPLPNLHPLINLMIPILREELSFFSRMVEVEINVSAEEGKGSSSFIPSLPVLRPGNGPFSEKFSSESPDAKGDRRRGKGRFEAPR